jgi:hypothetical protein
MKDEAEVEKNTNRKRERFGEEKQEDGEIKCRKNIGEGNEEKKERKKKGKIGERSWRRKIWRMKEGI